MNTFLRKLVSPLLRIPDFLGPPGAEPRNDLMWVANREPVPKAPNTIESGDPFGDPLKCLTQARKVGRRLSLPISLESLGRIRWWLKANAPFTKLDPGSLHILAAALHEATANIIEHGYGGFRSGEFDLWWVPPGEGGGKHRFDHRNPLKDSYFLILDQGTAFSADDREETDFTDPEAWRRGRGLGLDIIFRAMARVAYRPATNEGNITLLAFDPGELISNERQIRHG